MTKSRLRVSYSFHGALGGTDLPVEIRKPNMALVARGPGMKGFDLDPGTYVVLGRLPAGQEIAKQIEVSAAPEQKVELELSAEESSPHEWREVTHLLRQGPKPRLPAPLPSAEPAMDQWPPRSISPLAAPMTPQGSQLEALGPEDLRARLRLVQGNPLLRTAQVQAFPDWGLQAYQAGAFANFALNGAPTIQYIQLAQPGIPPVNMALPVAPGSVCTAVVERDDSGHVSLQVQLHNREADALLGYRECGDLDSAAAAAELLLYEKIEDPIAAAVGGYALLRLGSLDRLHHWTENLRQWFPWLADGAVIRGEHLAREGDHTAALTAFLELPARGLPLFSGGFSYVVNRLRVYTSLDPNPFPAGEVAAAHRALQELGRFAQCVDYARPILTFTGRDPNEPQIEELPEPIFLTLSGFDLGPLLG